MKLQIVLSKFTFKNVPNLKNKMFTMSIFQTSETLLYMNLEISSGFSKERFSFQVITSIR